jgi:hypothetical protein
MTPFMARDASAPTLIVDAENVRRSIWPNVSKPKLVELARAWAEDNGMNLVVVFDGPAPAAGDDLVSAEPSADDWIASHAEQYVPYWLVTSDRGLRARAGDAAERLLGGGKFVRELVDRQD